VPFCGIYFFEILLSLIIPIFIFSKWVINKIGGMLGDAFGAGEQIAETVILLFFVLIFSINGSISWMF
jgi:cobalamin synthase